MNSSKKIILAATAVGILALGGIGRAIFTTQPQRTVAIVPHRLIAQANDSFDPINDNDTEVNNDRIPASLSQVGEYGETVYDMAKVNDWTKATANLKQLQDAAKLLRTQSSVREKITQLDTNIAKLSQSVTAKERQAAMRDANQVTLTGAEMMMQFEPKVPVEITLLDYYGRELEIWAATGNTTKLKTTASEMRRIWNAVRPSILARGGATQVQKFELLVTSVETAKSPAEYARLATPVLDEVDNLEKVFK